MNISKMIIHSKICELDFVFFIGQECTYSYKNKILKREFLLFQKIYYLKT